jgi:hypothetical protein
MYFTEFLCTPGQIPVIQNIKLEVDRVKLYVEMQAQFLQISSVHHLRAENTVNRENRIHLSFWKLFLFGICIGMCYRFLDWAREMECKGARMIADKVLTMENERLASLGIYAVTDTELSSLSFVQIPASQLTLGQISLIKKSLRRTTSDTNEISVLIFFTKLLQRVHAQMQIAPVSIH